MKPCKTCDCQIPDLARQCPHCRATHRRGDWMPQAVLAAAAALAGAAAFADACPVALGRPLAGEGMAGLRAEGAPPVASSAEAGPAARRAAPPTIARLRYEGGGDWYANPSSLPNLLREIRERTGIVVATRPAEVRLVDPSLPDYPYLYATGHGNMRFSELELERLRGYLDRGGFLHVDDNYGLDESFRREVRRLFPDRSLAEVPLDHPIYGVLYEFPEGLPKVHEHDGLPAQGLGLFLDGRLALFYSYQSDLGDGWEDAAVHGDPPDVRERAIRMGVNLFLYALGSSPAR